MTAFHHAAAYSLNPFDASKVAPGSRSFQFASSDSKLQWWIRFSDALWHGAIVGPHGSGKTTLLRELLRPLDLAAVDAAKSLCDQATLDRIQSLIANALVVAVTAKADGRGLELVRLLPIDSGFSRQPLDVKRSWLSAIPADSWLIIDGYERLGFLSRMSVERARRKRRLALTVTSHRRERMPTLQECRVETPLAQQLIAQSLGQPSLWSDAEIERLLEAHEGNLREVFFTLYDQVAARTDSASK